MNKAFILGAGLGTRLRPLTHRLPKPLVPVLNKPLVTFGFDLLMHAGIEEFVINTHHLPEVWDQTFPDGVYNGASLRFIHESPEILETGGGLANAAPHLGDDPFVVFNGDILTSMPLEPAMIAHRTSGNLVTLILRTLGPNQNVHWDPESQKVLDLRGLRGTDCPSPMQFTGVYLVSPEFVRYLKPEPSSVVPAFIQVIEDSGRIGGTVIDDGFWWDLGTRDAYLDASEELAQIEDWSAFSAISPPSRVHESARIDPAAQVDELCVVGPHAVIKPGTTLRSTVLWDGACVEDGASLERCIVTSGVRVPAGKYQDRDL